MAVGVMYAGFVAGNVQITAASALALSLGIAIQNFPEGAIISMPLRAEGENKKRAFLGGVLSGVVEPVGAILTMITAQFIIPVLPYLLSFAAGAMLYVLSESVMLATDLLVATVKTTGSTGKAVAAMLAAHWKNSTQKEMGEISLKSMVKRKEPFDMLAMDTVDAGKFRRLAARHVSVRTRSLTDRTGHGKRDDLRVRLYLA